MDALKSISDKIEEYTRHPESYLNVQQSLSGNLRTLTKTIYDTSRTQQQDDESSQALPELIIDNFDDEQIWQQIELQNEPVISQVLSQLSKLATGSTVTFKSNISSASRISRQDEIKAKKRKVKKKQVHFEGDSSSDDENGGGNLRHEPSRDRVPWSDTAMPEEEDGDASDNEDGDLIPGTESGAESEEERMLQELLDRAAGEDQKDAGSEDEGDFGDIAMGDEYDDYDADEQLDFDFEAPKSESSKSNSNKHKKDVEASLFDKDTGDSKGSTKKKTKRKTEVDDKFFSLADMEEFLDVEDAKEERRRDGKKEQSDSEEEEIDYFAESPSQEKEDLHYGDFFDPPEGEEFMEGVQSDQESGDEEDDEEEEEDGSEEGSEDDEAEGATRRRDLLADSESEGEDVSDILGNHKSSYQQRKNRLAEKINAMEDAAVAEKPWQLMGEVQAADRPVNTLLEHDLEYEQQTKQAPVITEETTKTLEETIIQRIKDQAFDDVVRKVKPKEQAFEYKKRIELDQEKSKLSLGEVYEQEYLQQAEDKEEEYVDPKRVAIQKMMTSLFVKLDALSNFQFTPRAAIPDVEIVNNLPAVAMEEVTPLTASEATTLAPEQIHGKGKHTLKGESERTRTDKLRARREKKATQRAKEKRRKEREATAVSKAPPGVANKMAAQVAVKELSKNKAVTLVDESGAKQGNMTSSTQFFKQLQEEVTTHVRAEKAKNTKNTKLKSFSAAKLKL